MEPRLGIELTRGGKPGDLADKPPAGRRPGVGAPKSSLSLPDIASNSIFGQIYQRS